MKLVLRFFVCSVVTLIAGQSFGACGPAYEKALRGFDKSRVNGNIATAGISVGGGIATGALIGAGGGGAISTVPGAVVGGALGAFGGAVVWMSIGNDMSTDRETSSSFYAASELISDADVGDSLALRTLWQKLQTDQIVQFNYIDMVKTLRNLNDANSFCVQDKVVNDAGVVSLLFQAMSDQHLVRSPK